MRRKRLKPTPELKDILESDEPLDIKRQRLANMFRRVFLDFRELPIDKKEVKGERTNK
jgi:hypothetical protein